VRLIKTTTSLHCYNSLSCLDLNIFTPFSFITIPNLHLLNFCVCSHVVLVVLHNIKRPQGFRYSQDSSSSFIQYSPVFFYHVLVFFLDRTIFKAKKAALPCLIAAYFGFFLVFFSLDWAFESATGKTRREVDHDQITFL